MGYNDTVSVFDISAIKCIDIPIDTMMLVVLVLMWNKVKSSFAPVPAAKDEDSKAKVPSLSEARLAFVSSDVTIPQVITLHNVVKLEDLNYAMKVIDSQTPLVEWARDNWNRLRPRIGLLSVNNVISLCKNHDLIKGEK